jgi:hypothetical protein
MAPPIASSSSTGAAVFRNSDVLDLDARIR